MLQALQPLLAPFAKIAGLCFLAWVCIKGLKLFMSLQEVK